MKRLTKLQKAIRGVEMCLEFNCQECPYRGKKSSCAGSPEIMEDILALLKELEKNRRDYEEQTKTA